MSSRVTEKGCYTIRPPGWALHPGEFTLVLCGAFDPRRVRPMLEKYLASIPAPATPARAPVTRVTPVPFQFPSGVSAAQVVHLVPGLSVVQ